MIIFAIITRGTTVLAEYGTSAQNFTDLMLPIIGRNSSSGTRLVPVGQHLCAVMNKGVNREAISFACIIESNEERDNCFNFLDALASFYEKETGNPKMTTEMNAFLSKAIKSQMVRTAEQEKANTRLVTKEKLGGVNEKLVRSTEITKNSISSLH
jgi:hypothetical protein